MKEENKKYLQRFADDERMFEAVREELTKLGEMKELDVSVNNEELGAEARARIRAREVIEVEFRKIKSLRSEDKLKEFKNIAR